MIEGAAAEKVLHDARFGKGGKLHPVTGIADARLRSLVKPNPVLTGDAITEWLAGRLKIPFYHIDPLKIDLKAVTQVMSSDYAQRRGILPVEVSGKDVTIASSEPFLSAWEGELSQMLRLKINIQKFFL